MFFSRGDCNWRHNLNCQPQLNLLVAVFFVLGLALVVYQSFRKPYTLYPISYILFVWLFFMSLPATLTREGLPHALRSIGVIPPVMIFAGLGAWQSVQWILTRLERQKTKWPQSAHQLDRIHKEVLLLFILLLLTVPLLTYRQYFIQWAANPNTYFAFTTDIWHLGRFLNAMPPDIEKYVIVNLSGVDIRGIPAPAETVMFATDTFMEQRGNEKNIKYILPEELDKIVPEKNKKTVFALLNGADKEVIGKIRERFPEYSAAAPADFVIFKNY